jgi:site-specific DNA recombinase
MKPTSTRALRCAIYTRVSTDQGLEQEFNSLDAQREAAQAYIKSQAHEGWRLIRDRYDDGGFSGGSMQRPALQKLLADVKARRIDTIVVYKVDRLTRSLADFAKLVELFDEHGVSFVSVTQSFNTTTSMGRLTLNVLLSFAQFEREVTGERIRDKIAASKKKGIWVGGVVPLGYEVKDRKLIVNEPEAATVRMIFERYLALGSLPALQRALRAQGIITRKRMLSSGKTIGGTPLTNGPLAYMLRNRVSLGQINHRDQSYPGEHPSILDQALFDAVQAKLDDNLRGRALTNQRSRPLLLGKIYDDRGNRMTPSYAIKKGVRYRCYVSCVLAQGRKDEAGSVSRVAASEIEAIVAGALENRVPSIEWVAESSRRESGTHQDHHIEKAPTVAEGLNGPGLTGPMTSRTAIEKHIDRIVLRTQSVEIQWTDEPIGGEFADGAQPNSIAIAWRPTAFRRKRELMQPAEGARPIRAEARGKLLGYIARGASWLEEILSDSATRIETIAAREGLHERSARSILSLAFLAPDIVKGALAGTLPRGFGVSRLIDLPANWAEQRIALGLPTES